MAIKRLDKSETGSDQISTSENVVIQSDPVSLDEVKYKNEYMRQNHKSDYWNQIYIEFFISLDDVESSGSFEKKDIDESISKIVESISLIDEENNKMFIYVDDNDVITRKLLNIIRTHLKFVFGNDFLVIPTGDREKWRD